MSLPTYFPEPDLEASKLLIIPKGGALAEEIVIA
jgi:hypothetical protein